MANAKQLNKAATRCVLRWLPLATMQLLAVSFLGIAVDDALASNQIPLEVAERAKDAEEAHLLAAAQAKEDVGRLGEAERLYRALLQRWPESIDARQGLERVLRGHQAGVVDQKQRAVADELATVELRVALDRSEYMAAQGDFAEASQALDEAR